MIKWSGIVLHHSASPRGIWQGINWSPVTGATIRNWHVNERGWSDIGYHFLVLPDGKVEIGRPLDKIGAHTKASRRNFTAIGICLVGNFQYDSVPPPQLLGTVNFVGKLLKEWNIDINKVELHNEVPGAKTLCPGRYFPKEQFSSLLKNNIFGRK